MHYTNNLENKYATTFFKQSDFPTCQYNLKNKNKIKLNNVRELERGSSTSTSIMEYGDRSVR